jgi:hypothetical protein
MDSPIEPLRPIARKVERLAAAWDQVKSFRQLGGA